jgi:hypothetical protein
MTVMYSTTALTVINITYENSTGATNDYAILGYIILKTRSNSTKIRIMYKKQARTALTDD